jgi:hypothetical protein
MAVIRDAAGSDAYLLGCGAPIIPSVGHVDAMRVSNDIAPHWEHEDGDLALGGGRGAVMTGAARASSTAGCGSTTPTAYSRRLASSGASSGSATSARAAVCGPPATA